MKELPILMKGPMVRAILEGRKTQTRRIVKLPVKDPLTGCEIAGCEINSLLRQGEEICEYGVPGDRLWVRETFALCEADGPKWFYRADSDDDGTIPYLVSGAGGFGGGVGSMKVDRWKSSIFMPRWASRITLEIEAVRVERLIEISNDDAIAEGVVYRDSCWFATDDPKALPWMTALGAYRELWESINGPGSWDANPWVWVIQFPRFTT